MSEFQLDLGSSESRMRWNALDAFTQGYIEAAFWCGASEEGELDDKGFEDLAADSLAIIVESCRDFQVFFADHLAKAYASASVAYNESCAGHDFWLTRNGHGAGFWDRGLGLTGDFLSKCARPYGESFLYANDEPDGDGKVYVS